MGISNTEKGNILRDEVRALIQAAHKHNYDTEVPIIGKNVDVYYEEHLGMECIRYVVECKAYDSSIGITEVSKIVNDYDPLLKQDKIDRVQIVTYNGLSPQAKQRIDDYPRINHLTYDEFKCSLMNFSMYRESLIAQYSNDGLIEYYINPVLQNDIDAEEYIDKWIESENTKPIAILSGYGMGKTSISRRIAFKYASKSKEGKISRIPIFIKLGDIAKEQELEGLISKTLAAYYAVQGFHFDLFLALNRHGTFLIILDGFDEMKHMMSLSDFKSNLEELNRLITPKSKVMLLGRPSAFMSDDERLLMLHGRYMHHDKEVREVKFNDFEELSLADFTQTQAEEFFNKYLKYMQFKEHSLGGSDLTDEFIEQRIKELSSDKYHELTSRPVHVQMLASIYAYPEIELKRFNRYELYELFLSKLHERELGKVQRRAISMESRIDFIQNIAWYFWINGQTNGFIISEIPEWFINFEMEKSQHDRETIIREFITGSVLEPKGSDRFYFRHRSFQEFLVAQYILKHGLSREEIGKFSQTLNEEILSFIKESDDYERLFDIYSTLSEYKGTLNLLFLELILDSQIQLIEDQISNSEANPWKIIINFLFYLVHKDSNDYKDGWRKYTIELYAGVKNEEVKLAALLCLVLFIQSASDEKEKINAQNILAGLIIEQSIPEMENIISKYSSAIKKKKEFQIAASDISGNYFMEILLAAFIVNVVGNNIQINVELNTVFRMIIDRLKPAYEIEDISKIETETTLLTNVSILGEHLPKLKFTEKGGVCARYFKEFHKSDRIVPIRSKRNRFPNMPGWVTQKD